MYMFVGHAARPFELGDIYSDFKYEKFCFFSTRRNALLHFAKYERPKLFNLLNPNEILDSELEEFYKLRATVDCKIVEIEPDKLLKGNIKNG